MVPLTKVADGTEFGPLEIGPKTRVFVLTGAGISAESGLRTFRDSNGLWEEHEIEAVATPEGFDRDPMLVWRFYSERRRQAADVLPNPAHSALARLQKQIGDRLTVCTQNVDPLHERAGSTHVIHMHGELRKTRCTRCDRPAFEDDGLFFNELPACDQCRGLLRPHIVWFGEMPFDMDRIYAELERCDLFVTVGSSGAVYPAAGFVTHLRHVPNLAGRYAKCVYVGLERPENAHAFDECRLGRAGDLLPGLFACVV